MIWRNVSKSTGLLVPLVVCTCPILDPCMISRNMSGGCGTIASALIVRFGKYLQEAVRATVNYFPSLKFILFSHSSSLGDSLPPNMTVRRANSWPEMKKTTGSVQPAKDNIGKTLYETDEEGNMESRNGVVANKRAKQKVLTCSETQTENFWPMPYEHLFLGIFPSLENQEVKPSPAPSPAPISTQQEKYCPPVSVNEILDK